MFDSTNPLKSTMFESRDPRRLVRALNRAAKRHDYGDRGHAHRMSAKEFERAMTNPERRKWQDAR